MNTAWRVLIGLAYAAAWTPLAALLLGADWRVLLLVAGIGWVVVGVYWGLLTLLDPWAGGSSLSDPQLAEAEGLMSRAEDLRSQYLTTRDREQREHLAVEIQRTMAELRALVDAGGAK